MRLIKHTINPDGSGSVTLYPEEPEDMWHAFNLIRQHDLLTASAVRRVTNESSTTGSTSSHRVHTNLTISVKSLDFDAQAAQLHVAGRISKENSHVKIGQHHTLDLELNRNFTLEKLVDGPDGGQGWDSVARTQLQEACDPNKDTEAVAVVMQEGLANVCFITSYQTILKQRVEVPVPRKGTGRSQEHDKGLRKFFNTVLETLLRQLENLLASKDEAAHFPVLLASPGFTANGFLKCINEAASTKGNKFLQDLVKRKTFVVVHSSSGHLHSLNEVLASPEVRATLKDTKYAKETAMMDHFYTMLRKDDGRAWYGHKEVEKAADLGAIGRGTGTLFISNDLFRSKNEAERRRWVALVEKVKFTSGGEVRVLSSAHESGRRLQGLGGVAAILTFPIDDMELSSEENSPNGSQNDDSE